MASRKYPEGKYAWTVKVGEKGQFVIPKEARDIFDIQPGDTLIVLGDIKRGIAIPPKSEFESLLMNTFGGFAPEGEKR
jgi:AbrB family looped-hinge helix DNA binding protein